MATGKVPKHDFAPAWLKIPPQDSANHTRGSVMSFQRPPLRRPEYKAGQRKDEHSNYRHNDFYGHGLPRQRSFDSYEDRRHGPPRYRPNSIDDDYYSQGYHYNYYPGYNFDKYGNHHRSQPVLYRPPMRDGKYQHPNARFGQQMNGNFPHGPPPYYDYPYDFYHDSYYNHYVRGGHRRNSDNERNRERHHDEKSKPKQLDDDFPSLNGDTNNQSKEYRETGKAGGVWEHPPKVQSNSKNSGSIDSQRKETGIYKALVPNKSSNSRKQNRDSPKVNGTTEKDEPIKSTTDTVNEGNDRQQSPVSHDKLPSLDEDTDINSNDKVAVPNGDTTNEDVSESMDKLVVDPLCYAKLSSSLEAEQRLLREMGWSETDEEVYEITEDDKNEFLNLSKQMKQKKNGITKLSLPHTWSPKHLSFIPTGVEEDTSSLSSDSDLDID